MNFISAAKMRRLIPAGAVAAVLVFSYMAPLPSAASSVGGFGYNCGVKGYGYHDHGKPCPNRPFPGRGIGLTKLLGDGETTNHASTNQSQGNGKTSNPANHDTKTTTTSGDSDTSGKGHGRGRGHGRGDGPINL